MVSVYDTIVQTFFRMIVFRFEKNVNDVNNQRPGGYKCHILLSQGATH